MPILNHLVSNQVVWLILKYNIIVRCVIVIILRSVVYTAVGDMWPTPQQASVVSTVGALGSSLSASTSRYACIITIKLYALSIKVYRQQKG